MKKLLTKITGQLHIGIFLQLFLFSIIPGINDAQVIRIGLFPDENIRSLVFSNVKGIYSLYADGTYLLNILPGEIYYATIADNKIQLSNKMQNIGSFSKLETRQADNESAFQLKPVSPVLASADYDGDLILIPSGNYFQIINGIDLEKYVAAVIEAEGGSNAHLEYYKAQAILIRTYAIKNMYRHGAQNYNLCSSVHCQAYKGKSMLNKQIYEAAFSTSGLVLTDKDSNLITAPYHSNCGGLTCSADVAWQKRLPCLISIHDPFCVSGKNSSWSQHVPVDKWTGYLQSNGLNTEGMSIKDYVCKNPGRVKFYTIGNVSIPMKKIRDDFQLKSAYFQISYENGDYLIFKGKGFGHGVGLCQEGAMEMAKAGYTYPDIIHFYFQNVLICNYHKILSGQPVK
jgi:stage II sporulation protein D